MARAVKGFSYGNLLALTSRRGADVERMNPRLRKVYLQRHLKLVEAQIQFLSHRLGLHDAGPARDLSWSESTGDNEVWGSLVNLDYLMAARDALRRTLDTL